MATPEITLRGDVRDAVIGCVVRDIESSLDAVQAEYGTALQTFDCLDLLNARAHARSLANAIELLARLVDSNRVDQEVEREREFAEIQQDQEPVPEDEVRPAAHDDLGAVADDDLETVADDDLGAVAEEGLGVGQRPGRRWPADIDQKMASDWIGDTAELPDFLETSRRNTA